ncbi:MAG: glycerophosphodiester phosphodiesterase [Fluviicola sp.]
MRFVTYICLISLFLFGCKREDQFDQVTLVAHACSGLLTSTTPYHDNSEEAFIYALSLQGIDAIEVDVQLSADGTLWLFHDPELSTETNGSGCVSEVSDTYLSSLHYTTQEKEKLIRLQDLPQNLEGKKLILDLRHSNTCSNEFLKDTLVFNAVQQLVTEKQWTDLVLILGTPSWTELFSSLGFEIYVNAYDLNYYNALNVPQATGPCIRSAVITKEEVDKIHQDGKKVIIFDVRSPKGIRKALKKYPDLLMVDDPRAAIIEKYR